MTRALHDPVTFSNAVSQHLSVSIRMEPSEYTAYRRMQITNRMMPHAKDAKDAKAGSTGGRCLAASSSNFSANH